MGVSENERTYTPGTEMLPERDEKGYMRRITCLNFEFMLLNYLQSSLTRHQVWAMHFNTTGVEDAIVITDGFGNSIAATFCLGEHTNVRTQGTGHQSEKPASSLDRIIRYPLGLILHAKLSMGPGPTNYCGYYHFLPRLRIVPSQRNENSLGKPPSKMLERIREAHQNRVLRGWHLYRLRADSFPQIQNSTIVLDDNMQSKNNDQSNLSTKHGAAP
ncbi:hypothetical protein BJV77DRAFT_1131209 [Russula vinacea]|nr:hypothetical protein BJV77DRAFT_1131209 [Russula vinacea]